MARESEGSGLRTGQIQGLQPKTSWPWAIGRRWTLPTSGEVETNLLLSATFAQEVGVTVDELWKCVFMCLFGCVCVAMMCVFQSLQHLLMPKRSNPHPHPQPSSLLSAVRRTGDCCLGDHYRGHKRAIYRTSGEWSQHSSLTPHPHDCTVLGHQWGAQNRESSRGQDDLNMRAQKRAVNRRKELLMSDQS